jgi:hypothetical protein
MNHFQSNGLDLKIFVYIAYSNIIYILDSFGPKNGGLSFQPSRNIIKWKGNGKIKPCPHVKSLPLLYGGAF